MTSKKNSSPTHGFYHVMLRGNHRQTIFFEDKHRFKFFDYLKSLTKKFDCKIHLFCLMTNHVHLVIETYSVPLSKIMQSLSSSYTRYINRSMELSGHLFQGNYKAQPIHSVQYFLKLCQYIHLNPKQANMVEHLDEYPWSSHLAYRGKSKPDWLSTEFLDMLLKDAMPYEILISAAERGESDFNEIMSIEDVSTNEGILSPFRQKPLCKYSLLTLKEIIQCICEEMGVTEKSLQSTSLERHLCLTRSLVAFFGHYQAGYTLKRVSVYLAQHPKNVSKTMHMRIENETLQPFFKRIQDSLEILMIEKQAQWSD